MKGFFTSILGGAKSELNKANDVFITEETKVRKCITTLLAKKGTTVSMAPESKKFIITNKTIGLNVLIDGSAEVVKTTNHKFKYGWKFRGEFINEMIKLAIVWIEKDRAKTETEIFINEMSLLNDLDNLINTLEDVTEEDHTTFSKVDGSVVIG